MATVMCVRYDTGTLRCRYAQAALGLIVMPGNSVSKSTPTPIGSGTPQQTTLQNGLDRLSVCSERRDPRSTLPTFRD